MNQFEKVTARTALAVAIATSVCVSVPATAGQWAKAGAIGFAAETLTGVGERVMNSDTMGAIDTALVHRIMEEGSFSASAGVEIKQDVDVKSVEADNSAVNIAVTEAADSKVTSLKVEQDVTVQKVKAEDSLVEIGMVGLNGFKGNSVDVTQNINVGTVKANGSAVKMGGAYLGQR